MKRMEKTRETTPHIEPQQNLPETRSQAQRIKIER